jgi:hypothetical protein
MFRMSAPGRLMPLSVTVHNGRPAARPPAGVTFGSTMTSSLNHMFNFGARHGKNKVLLLDPTTGQPGA